MPFSHQKNINSMLANALRKAPDFFGVLLDNNRQLLFVKDKNSRILYANKAFLKLYPPDQRDHIIGAASAENFYEEDAAVFLSEDRKAIAYGYTEILEEIHDYQGQTFYFQTQKIRFYDEKGEPYILGIGTDVGRLVEREKQLAQSNMALDNFAVVAAHDLRSPLGSITSSLDFISQDEETKLGPRAVKHMRLIDNCLEGLREQISTLLESCKSPEKDEREINFVECDLSTIFEEARFSLAVPIERSRAKVLSNQLPRMKINKPLFRELITNLIENSLKYRSTATPIIILRHDLQDGDHIFSIEDNGVGIKDADKAKVFDLFEQSDKKNDGYGIGLSLCRDIVQMHKGKIWIDPNYVSGCRIYFKIPDQIA